ncbi:unnamed protein product, partial [marine sediment metagenome]
DQTIPALPTQIEQGSPEWFQMRCGKLTASKLALAVTRTKGGWCASRENVMVEIACERLTGRPTESFTSMAMQWGKDTEPLARMAYSFETGHEVKEVAFVDHPDIEWSGASPDGVIKKGNGLVEIKCPNSATHLKTLTGGAIPKKYLFQMAWQMACTGAAWCDYASYDPRMPDNLQLHITRVPLDEDLVSQLEQDAKEFLSEVDVIVHKLQAMGAGDE